MFQQTFTAADSDQNDSGGGAYYSSIIKAKGVADLAPLGGLASSTALAGGATMPDVTSGGGISPTARAALAGAPALSTASGLGVTGQGIVNSGLDWIMGAIGLVVAVIVGACVIHHHTKKKRRHG